VARQVHCRSIDTFRTRQSGQNEQRCWKLPCIPSSAYQSSPSKFICISHSSPAKKTCTVSQKSEELPEAWPSDVQRNVLTWRTTNAWRCACRDSTTLHTRNSSYVRSATTSAQTRWPATASRTRRGQRHGGWGWPLSAHSWFLDSGLLLNPAKTEAVLSATAAGLSGVHSTGGIMAAESGCSQKRL